MRKEREEAHLYMQVIVGSLDNFRNFEGMDIFPVVSDERTKAAQPKVHRILKSTKLGDFRAMVGTELGIDADLVRPWGLVGRQNHTFRPDTPMDWYDLSMEEAQHKLSIRAPLRIWIETTTRNADGQPDWMSSDLIQQSRNPSQPILLFLKYFDVEKQVLAGHSTLYIDKSKRVSELGPIILERLGWPAGTNVRLYEEIKMDMIEPLKTSNTFQQSELQSGDIVCFQKHVTEAEASEIISKGQYPDVKQFYEYLINRIKVLLWDRNHPEDSNKDFYLELSRKMNYDQVAAKVGEHLGVPPTHLRFSSVLQATGKVRQELKRSSTATLGSMLSSQVGIYGQTAGAVRPDQLAYEVLDISLAELETKKQVKLTWLSEGITKEEVFDVLVPRTGVVRDFIAPLRAKAKFKEEDEPRVRFYEVHSNKVFKELDDDHPVSGFNNFITIYAELTPKEEDDADPAVDRPVYCFHFDKEPTKVHSVPFKFIVKPVCLITEFKHTRKADRTQGEPFKETKERLSRRTGIKGKNFERIKFAVIGRLNLLKPEYLNDGMLRSNHKSALVLTNFQRTSSTKSSLETMPLLWTM